MGPSQEPRKRILHFGKNVANNPYNNVKALVAAEQDRYTFSVLSFDNPHGMAQPEWEEVSANTNAKAFHNKWSRSSIKDRPDWFSSKYSYKYSPRTGKRRIFPIRHVIEKVKDRLLILLVSLGITRSRQHTKLPKSFRAWIKVLLFIGPCVFFYLLCKLLVRIESFTARHFYLPLEIVKKLQWLETEKQIPRSVLDRYVPALCRIRFWIRDYDLVQVYSTDAVYAYLCEECHYIVYDNGPLREFGVGDKPVDSLLRLSYLDSVHVLLTNPDVFTIALDIGITRYSHVPHYIDTERYCSGPNTFRNSMENPDTFLVFAPARQNWPVKGNNIIIEGFAKFVKQHPSSLLLIADWGQHTDNSRSLVHSLGISHHVQFYQPIVKSRFVDYLRAADVVIDQCIIPTIGGIGPEAMSTETPLLTSYDHAVNSWCFPVPPPLIPVFDADSIATALQSVLTSRPDTRESLSKQSRNWVNTYCGSPTLIDGHLRCYDATFSSNSDRSL